MKAVRVVWRYTVSLFTALLLLLWAYPWRISYGAFTFSRLKTSIAYAIVAFVMPLVVLAAFQGLCAFGGTHRSNISLTISTAIVSTVAFAAIAWLFGPMGLDIPGTRVQGIFFSEWNFITFIFKVVPPYALLSAVVFVWRKREPENLHGSSQAKQTVQMRLGPHRTSLRKGASTTSRVAIFSSAQGRFTGPDAIVMKKGVTAVRGDSHVVRKPTQNVVDGDPHTADAWLAVALVGFDRDTSIPINSLCYLGDPPAVDCGQEIVCSQPRSLSRSTS